MIPLKYKFVYLFYSIEIIPQKVMFLFKLNPLYQYLTAARDVVLYSRCPSMSTLIAITGYSILAILIGTIVFKKNQDKFVYYI